MINVQGKIPDNYYVACSGGVDSMAVLDFLSNGRHRPKAAYFHHGTEHSEKAGTFVKEYCAAQGIELAWGRISRERLASESMEEYWRNERYAFLHALGAPVITAHHLGDCMETWIFTCLHGQGKIIPYRNQTVIRPFRGTPKENLVKWCTARGVPWVDDASNANVLYARNRIRHLIMPEALKINPGLSKVIKKKIAAEAV